VATHSWQNWEGEGTALAQVRGYVRQQRKGGLMVRLKGGALLMKEKGVSLY